jgi:hypothetical protein
MSEGTALATARWMYPVAIAAAASWRLVLTVSIIAIMPASALSLLFVAIGVSFALPLLLILATTSFALSYFFHELGHAVCLWLIAGRTGGSREMLAEGTFLTARVTRWSQGDDADALVSIVGPLAGVAAGLFVLLPFWPFLASFPFFCLFLVHVASLAPRFSDGQQLFASFDGWVRHARRS